MQLTVQSRRPPLIVLALAIGLHFALVVSVQFTASKSSVSELAFATSAAMVVRSIDAPAAPDAVVPAVAPAETLPSMSSRGLADALSDAPLIAPLSAPLSAPPAASPTAPPTAPPTASPTIAVSKSAAVGASTLASLPPVVASPPKPEAPGSAPSETLPAAPQYRSAGSLDPGPKPLSDINPDYPARAGQQQGVVVLRLLINEQGVVDNVAVVRAAPAGYFEESALEAFGKALFSPGKLLGIAVKSQITVEVEFMPINRGATVSGRTY